MSAPCRRVRFGRARRAVAVAMRVVAAALPAPAPRRFLVAAWRDGEPH